MVSRISNDQLRLSKRSYVVVRVLSWFSARHSSECDRVPSKSVQSWNFHGPCSTRRPIPFKTHGATISPSITRILELIKPALVDYCPLQVISTGGKMWKNIREQIEAGRTGSLNLGKISWKREHVARPVIKYQSRWQRVLCFSILEWRFVDFRVALSLRRNISNFK